MYDAHCSNSFLQPDRLPVSAGEVVIGLISAPGVAAQVAADLAEDLRAELSVLMPTVRWRVPTVVDALVHPPADDAVLVGAARERLLVEAWDLVVCLTDLPLSVRRRPVVAYASPVHGVAVVCLPALGAVRLRRRASGAVVGLVRTLLGEAEDHGSAGSQAALRRRAGELGSQQEGGDGSVMFTARVLKGNVRLLVGMIRANQPWRLAIGLSKALTAALAAGVFAMITSDIWQLGDALSWTRLTAIGMGAVAAITASLILGAGLWERGSNPAGGKHVTLFNLATTGTVVLGVTFLYTALLLLALLITPLLVPAHLLEENLGHAVQVGDYFKLAVLASALATVGGALGAGLESDEAVRAAAYTYRQEPGEVQRNG